MWPQRLPSRSRGPGPRGFSESFLSILFLSRVVKKETMLASLNRRNLYSKLWLTKLCFLRWWIFPSFLSYWGPPALRYFELNSWILKMWITIIYWRTQYQDSVSFETLQILNTHCLCVLSNGDFNMASCYYGYENLLGSWGTLRNM